MPLSSPAGLTCNPHKSSRNKWFRAVAVHLEDFSCPDFFGMVRAAAALTAGAAGSAWSLIVFIFTEKSLQ